MADTRVADALVLLFFCTTVRFLGLFAYVPQIRIIELIHVVNTN